MARNNTRERIEDFGEKIGGAKKDFYGLFKEYKFTAKDLESLNYKEVIENINKKTLLKKPDYVAMADSGVPQDEVYLLKRVFDGFPTTFKINGSDEAVDRQRASDYTEVCKGLNELFSNYTGMADFPQCVNYLIDSGYLAHDKSSYYPRYTMTEKGSGTNVTAFVNRLLSIKHDQYDARRKVRQTNFPYKEEKSKEKLTEREKIEQKYKLMPMSGEKVAVVENKNHGLILEVLNNADDAQRYYEQFIDMEVEKAERAKIVPEQLSHLRRKGKDYTDGKDVTPELFMQTFQFRGVEFGNWNSINDRQENLNWAFNSLMDLADIMKVSPNALSLNGKLALAFGSRGSGNALAHYESARVVINLTKMRGAGSLAHEWMHALDDYLGRLYGCKATEYLSNTTKRSDNEYRPIYDKMKAVMENIKHENVPFEEYKVRLTTANEELKVNILNTVELLKIEGMDIPQIQGEADLITIRPREITKIYKEHVQQVSASTVIKLQENLMRYQRNSNELSYNGDYYNPRKESDFYKAAKDMSQKYWSKDVELLARAFESHVDHTLRENGLKSDYLQKPVLNRHLYLSESDTRVFTAFNELIDSLDMLDRRNLIKSDITLIEQEHVIEMKGKDIIEPETSVAAEEADETIETGEREESYINDEQNPAIEEEEKIEFTQQSETKIKPVNKDELKEKLTEFTVSKIEHEGETYILYPAFLEDKKNYGGYVLYDCMSEQETYDSIDDVVNTFADVGISKEQITQGYKVLSYEILPNSNNCYDILASKNTFTARVSENFAHRTDNINLPFMAYKKDGMVYVTSYKENKDAILTVLRQRDKEIGKISYKDMCKTQGANKYVELTPAEYETLQLTRFHYAAFEKGQNINVVIKEKDLNNMLTLIGRDYEGRVATRSYVELRGNGFPESVPFADKEFIEILKVNDVRYCGITNESKGVYTLLIHNDDKEKYDDLKREHEQELSNVMNLK